MATLKRRRLAVLLVLLISTVAACSSSGTSGQSSATPSGADGTSAGGSSVAAALAATRQAEQAPTSLRLTTPLKSPPPAGKLFVWMNCGTAACGPTEAALKKAVAAAGWKYKEINYNQADPASLVTALQQALQFHPAAVGLSGLPQAVWASVLPDYKSAGIPIITSFVGPQQIDGPVIANIANPGDETEYGTMLGNWFASDSGGKGSALVVTFSTFPAMKVVSDGLNATVAKACPACKMTALDMTINQLNAGTVNSSIVAALERDRSLNYVLVMDGAFINGLPAALSAAGLTGKIRIGSAFGSAQNLADIKAGSEQATTPVALAYASWLDVDAAIRHSEGMPLPDYEGTLPKQLITRGVKDFTVSDSFDVPSNYETLMKQLWHVG